MSHTSKTLQKDHLLSNLIFPGREHLGCLDECVFQRGSGVILVISWWVGDSMNWITHGTLSNISRAAVHL